MNTKLKIALAIVAGAALGATAMQGLHAQAKPKAYSVNEVEILDSAALATFLPKIRAAIDANHGRSLFTLNGRITTVEGSAAPQNVGIVEWDSLDDAKAFYKSQVWADTAAQRAKAEKTIRRYIVEAEK